MASQGCYPEWRFPFRRQSASARSPPEPTRPSWSRPRPFSRHKAQARKLQAEDAAVTTEHGTNIKSSKDVEMTDEQPERKASSQPEPRPLLADDGPPLPFDWDDREVRVVDGRRAARQGDERNRRRGGRHRRRVAYGRLRGAFRP